MLDHTQLDVFNQRLAKVTHSHITGVMIHDVMCGQAQVNRIHGVDPARMGAMLGDHDLRDDPWIQVATPLLATCRVLDSDDMVPRQVAQRSGFYHAYYRRLDIVQQVACVGLFDGFSSVTLSICHDDPARAYGDVEMELLRRLTPHWVNAYAMMRRMRSLEQRAESLEQALDASPVAMFVLSRDLRILRTNSGAERLLSRGALQRIDARLAAPGASAQPLQGLLHRAARGLGRMVQGDVERLVLPGEADRPEQVLTAHPLAAMERPGDAALLVFVREVGYAAGSLERALQQLFGLTGAEARLATALYRHVDLASAALECGVAPTTAQTRLKTIFGKTGERGQAALVRLLSAIAATCT
ncbi:PAS domain-containing protein [Pseudoxanthomonas daejeonensis]|uniref:PAS domain-containing protein n=1 Tax=Pseudoxanthomonas daejeonensis TaxID=266062 RepID=UPI001F542478|nr:PAS domain-containing protein [Pseudoxanthomonas daejeonensis]UNK58869.1 PAS domain-containing protein [Pseudoxanthomonas daejeonensis]